jgi:hypothetical protein
MSNCPVEGCKNSVKAGHLMCLAHWRLVPQRLQRAVNRTWRAYQRGRTHELLEDYRTARDAAVAAAAKEAKQGGLF